MEPFLFRCSLFSTLLSPRLLGPMWERNPGFLTVSYLPHRDSSPHCSFYFQTLSYSYFTYCHPKSVSHFSSPTQRLLLGPTMKTTVRSVCTKHSPDALAPFLRSLQWLLSPVHSLHQCCSDGGLWSGDCPPGHGLPVCREITTEMQSVQALPGHFNRVSFFCNSHFKNGFCVECLSPPLLFL